MTVTSTNDYRGSNALSLTVTAISQDGVICVIVSETTAIEMYQPVQWLDGSGSEREGSVALSKAAGSRL